MSRHQTYRDAVHTARQMLADAPAELPRDAAGLAELIYLARALTAQAELIDGACHVAAPADARPTVDRCTECGLQTPAPQHRVQGQRCPGCGSTHTVCDGYDHEPVSAGPADARYS